MVVSGGLEGLSPKLPVNPLVSASSAACGLGPFLRASKTANGTGSSLCTITPWVPALHAPRSTLASREEAPVSAGPRYHLPISLSLPLVFFLIRRQTLSFFPLRVFCVFSAPHTPPHPWIQLVLCRRLERTPAMNGAGVPCSAASADHHPRALASSSSRPHLSV